MRVPVLVFCLLSSINANAQLKEACPAPQAPMAASQISAINTELDSYIKKGMQDWKIPGLAIRGC